MARVAGLALAAALAGCAAPSRTTTTAAAATVPQSAAAVVVPDAAPEPPPVDPVRQVLDALAADDSHAPPDRREAFRDFPAAYARATEAEKHQLFAALLDAMLRDRRGEADYPTLRVYFNVLFQLRDDPRLVAAACDPGRVFPARATWTFLLFDQPQARACALFARFDDPVPALVATGHRFFASQLLAADTAPQVEVLAEMIRGTNAPVARMEPDAERVREAALSVLAEMLPAHGADALLALLRDDVPPATRLRVARILADVAILHADARAQVEQGFAAKIDELIARGTEPAWDEATQCVYALAPLGDAALLPLYERALAALARGRGDTARRAVLTYARVLAARPEDLRAVSRAVARIRGAPGAPVDPRQFPAMLALLRSCGEGNAECAARALGRAGSEEVATEAAALLRRASQEAGPAVTRPLLLDALDAGLPKVSPRGGHATGIPRWHLAVELRTLAALSPDGCDACVPALERGIEAFEASGLDVNRAEDIRQAIERLRRSSHAFVTRSR